MQMQHYYKVDMATIIRAKWDVMRYGSSIWVDSIGM